MMYAASVLPEWADKFLLPAFFILLGALLSLFISEWKDHHQAKKRKQAFLRAVGMELEALTDQLNASLREVDASQDRLQAFGTGPYIVGTVRIIVFTSQLGKLRDVDDPVIMEVIKLYSDLGIVEKILESVNEHGKIYNATTSDVQKSVARSRVNSTLLVFKEEAGKFLARIQTVRSKLPPALG
jgi:carboxylesterase type B